MQHSALPIYIAEINSISPLGLNPDEIWESYKMGRSCFEQEEVQSHGTSWQASLKKEQELILEKIVAASGNYQHLDRTTLLALGAADQLSKINNRRTTGVNIGSSRGATSLFEGYHKDFVEKGMVSAYSSPTTTLGNISSWVGQHLKLKGVSLDHSVTCSTGMHSMLNGIAWLKSGMSEQFIAGASEAALTPFTMAQMKALRLYSSSENSLACESMRFQKTKNTMVLGEGASVVLLDAKPQGTHRAQILGYGYGTELLDHMSSLSANAQCFQDSMRMALEMAGLDNVDCVVMHAPGTVKGDLAEKTAIDQVFNDKLLPLLTSNKWIIGHTFATSGLLSLEMAVLMLERQMFIENPFFANRRHAPEEIKTIMINAVGFGGNAVSIIISRPDFTN